MEPTSADVSSEVLGEQPYRMFTSSSDEDLLLAVEYIAEQEGMRTPRRNRLVFPRVDEEIRRTPGANRPVTPRPPTPDLFSPGARNSLFSSPETQRRLEEAGYSNTYLLESVAVLQIENVTVAIQWTYLNPTEATRMLDRMLQGGISTTNPFINGTPARIIRSLSRHAFQNEGQAGPSGTQNPPNLGQMCAPQSPDPFEFPPRGRRLTTTPERFNAARTTSYLSQSPSQPRSVLFETPQMYQSSFRLIAEELPPRRRLFQRASPNDVCVVALVPQHTSEQGQPRVRQHNWTWSVCQLCIRRMSLRCEGSVLSVILHGKSVHVDNLLQSEFPSTWQSQEVDDILLQWMVTLTGALGMLNYFFVECNDAERSALAPTVWSNLYRRLSTPLGSSSERMALRAERHGVLGYVPAQSPDRPGTPETTLFVCRVCRVLIVDLQLL